MSGIRQITVNTTGELISAVGSLAPSFGRSEYWFRGHNRQREFSLVASAFRGRDPVQERQLALRFYAGAVGRTANCPTQDDFGSWLVLMRHYGLPTRLLDWTRSLVVAAYFAILHQPLDEDAAIWLLVPERLNQRVQPPLEGIALLNGGNTNSVIRPITEAAFQDVRCEGGPYAVLSQDLDMRVLVQSGAFTIHTSGEPLEELPKADEFLARFDIPARQRQTFRDELWAMGAKRSLLFPDLQHLAIELAEEEGRDVRINERQV
jgi:hypothetical protein